MNKNSFCCKTIFQGVICKETRIFMGFPIFLVLDKNQCYRFFSCVTFLFVCYSGLFVIDQFCEFDILMESL